MTESLDWRKSSYSGGNAGACVEVAVSWRKSSYSKAETNCVEVAETPDSVLVRDTQHRDLGHLGFAPAEWVAFLADLRAGRL